MIERNELKKFIQESLIGKQKSIPYNRQTYRWYEIRHITNYYNSIIEQTSYLPEETTKFNERCYQIINDLFEIQTCPTCSNPINYIDFTNGYRIYCKPACATKGKKQIDIFIEKYGEGVGTKKYDNMIKNKTQSEERFITLYGEKEGKKRWKSRNKKCKNNVTLEGFIERYGNEMGKEKFSLYKDKLSDMQKLDTLIEKNGKKIGTEIYNEIIRKKSQTLDRFIEIYGDEDGLKKFNEYKTKQSKNSLSNISQESLDFFNPLLEFILEISDNDALIQNTYIGKKNQQEYFLNDLEYNKTYFYDLTIEPLKLIFEYNGSAFHPNKKLLSEDEWNDWKTPYSNIAADDKFKHDQRKLEIARLNGFEIFEIWDTDNKDLALENCKIIIENKVKEILND